MMDVVDGVLLALLVFGPLLAVLGARPLMGRKSRTKGKAGELEIMHVGRAAGLDVEKVSRAGYVGHDLEASLLGARRRIEVKRRSTGLKQIYSWLANADIVVARVDRKKAIVVLPLSLALQIAAKAETQ